MAAIIDNNDSVSSNRPSVRIKEYSNGKTFIVCPENAGKDQNIVCVGPKKLSMLFQRDKDGDLVLETMFHFLMAELPPADRERIRQNVMAFAAKF